jgi:hypothetical protein
MFMATTQIEKDFPGVVCDLTTWVDSPSPAPSFLQIGSDQKTLTINEALLPPNLAENIKVWDIQLRIRIVGNNVAGGSFVFKITATHPCVETILDPVEIDSARISIHDNNTLLPVNPPADSVGLARKQLDFCGPRNYTSDDPRVRFIKLEGTSNWNISINQTELARSETA